MSRHISGLRFASLPKIEEIPWKSRGEAIDHVIYSKKACPNRISESCELRILDGISNPYHRIGEASYRNMSLYVVTLVAAVNEFMILIDAPRTASDQATMTKTTVRGLLFSALAAHICWKTWWRVCCSADSALVFVCVVVSSVVFHLCVVAAWIPSWLSCDPVL